MAAKFILTLVLATVGLAAAAEVSPSEEAFLKSLGEVSETDTNSVIILHHMLRRSELVPPFEIPADKVAADGQTVGGLVSVMVYGAATGGTQTKEQVEADPKGAYTAQFNRLISGPCNQLLDKVYASAAEIEKNKVKVVEGRTETWLSAVKECEKILNESQYWITASFDLAKQNGLF